MNEINDYPAWIDLYFKDNDVVIYRLPDSLRLIDKQALQNKTIKTIKQFVKYLNTELKFWDYKGIENNIIVCDYVKIITKTLEELEKLKILPFGESSNNLLNNIISNYISKCQISSITNLAKWFKQFADKKPYFFHGFKDAITDSVSSYSNYSQWHEGYYYGVEYKNAIKSIEILVANYGMSFKEAFDKTEKELTDLVTNSSNLFYSQQQEILEVKNSTLQEIEQEKKAFLDYKQKKEQELNDLENLYQEKLKLSKPAEYWNKMSKSYRRSGVLWLITSAIISLLIISGLGLIIIFTPNLFEKNSYWLDLVKDTALLTVITSVAIYILRITIKLSLSSFHLSRDAKEREQLAYFYLSLMESKGITETERALIINSLFSRSETGLLKGDSAPSMTSNITDFIEK